MRNWGIAKLICMSKVRNFSEIAPNIAFPEFIFYDLIFLKLKHAINVKLLWETCSLVFKNIQKNRPKRPGSDIKLKY